jgi:hypothetical protein
MVIHWPFPQILLHLCAIIYVLGTNTVTNIGDFSGYRVISSFFTQKSSVHGGFMG